MAKRIKDYDTLYFEQSRKIGKKLNEETMKIVNRFQNALDKRFTDITQINLPV